VASISGPDAIQLEAKYSEARHGLDEPFADGPWTLSNGLVNSFRVEAFNITRPGHVESFFQQGGQRWQGLRLLNNDTTVRLCGVGIRSLNERTEVGQLPGNFASSKHEQFSKLASKRGRRRRRGSSRPTVFFFAGSNLRSQPWGHRLQTTR
jgi:hypothetical protein